MEGLNWILSINADSNKRKYALLDQLKFQSIFKQVFTKLTLPPVKS